MSSLLHKFETLLKKYPAVFTYIIKPAFILIIAVIMGYFTLWLNSNYLPRKDFVAHEEKQDAAIKGIDVKLNEILMVAAKTEVKVTAIKESIEDQKRDTDKLDLRVTYLERKRDSRDNGSKN